MRDAQGNRCIQSTWIRWAPKPDRMTYVLTYRPVIGVLTLVFALLIACDSDHDIVLAHDLVAPRGLARAADGGILVAEGGAGRVLALRDDGEVVEVATGLPVSLDAGPGGNTAAGPSGVTPWPNEGDALAVVVGEYRGGRFSRVYAVAADGSVEGVTPESDPLDSVGMVNPYDVVALGADLIVSDPGANALWRVTAAGDVLSYAEFADLEGLVEGRTVEVVPTGMHLAPDGTLYVASLTGYPYPVDAASVYAIRDMNDDGDALDAGEVTVAATGFTAATDVAAYDGGLLVTEYSADMRALVEEHGVDEAEAVPGRLVRWDDGAITVVTELVSPTSVLVDGNAAIVCEEFRGRVLRVALD